MSARDLGARALGELEPGTWFRFGALTGFVGGPKSLHVDEDGDPHQKLEGTRYYHSSYTGSRQHADPATIVVEVDAP